MRMLIPKLCLALILVSSMAMFGCGECVTCVGSGQPSAVAPAGSCRGNLASPQRVYPWEGWNGGLSVNVEPETCAWSAVSRNTNCVVITSGNSGVGDGEVLWRLLVNGAGGRTCSIAVTGDGWAETYTIVQNPR